MKLSTRSRYGLRMMYELALHYGKEPVIIKDISHNQDISEKYLSKIIIPLKGARLVYSSRGSHGGYILSRDPSEITVREIIEVLEGGIAPVDCSKDSAICSRSSDCPSRDVWCRLENTITGLLESISLADMLKNSGDSSGGFSRCGDTIPVKRKTKESHTASSSDKKTTIKKEKSVK